MIFVSFIQVCLVVALLVVVSEAVQSRTFRARHQSKDILCMLKSLVTVSFDIRGI